MMAVKKVRGGYKAKSAITKKWFKTVHKTKAGAESQWRTSKKINSNRKYIRKRHASRKRKR